LEDFQCRPPFFKGRFHIAELQSKSPVESAVPWRNIATCRPLLGIWLWELA
jgi:hypothetical protein